MTGSGRYVHVSLRTSRSSRADLVEGLKSGADYYIEKPIHEMNCWSGSRLASA